jgi:FkbM family methyltransferase
MLIDLHNLVSKYNIKFKGILHVGAHECEEIVYYDKYLQRDKVLWIDALVDKVALCKQRYSDILIENAVVSDVIETVVFHRSNNDQSSSILNLGIHKIHHPHIYYTNEFEVQTQLLSNILADAKYSNINFNFINLDIQGAELKALRGMEQYLDNIDYIYTEVNEDYVYENCGLITELDDYLGKWGFVRKETQWCGNTKWGDAFYIKIKQIQDTPIKLSLCIPTKDRYDTFLGKSLEHYVAFLKEGIIDEIVIADETLNDYDKIFEKYNDIILGNQFKFKLIKNNKILGVFLNKIQVCNLASNDLVALIDSDNFADKEYFINAKEYIKTLSNSGNSNVIIAPSFAKPHEPLNYKEFAGRVITKGNIREFIGNMRFQVFLNTGNYILSKNITKNIKYDSSILENITSCDVIFFNLLALQQFNNLEIHILNNMEYTHNVHDDSEYLKTHHKCDHTLNNFVIPQYYILS